MKKVESPTGCVHAVANGNSMEAGYGTLCKHRDYYRVDGYWHHWPLTDKEVTCKRCLKLINAKERYRRRTQALSEIIEAVSPEEFEAKVASRAIEALNNRLISNGKQTLRWNLFLNDSILSMVDKHFKAAGWGKVEQSPTPTNMFTLTVHKKVR